jgi:hypothetical protein
MGRSARTVRGQLARGELPGQKRNGRWYVDRRHLPLTESQRRTLQEKAQKLRQAVDDVLPSRLARTGGDRSRSLADLDAFSLGAEFYSELQNAASGPLDESRRRQVAELLERGLLAVAEATYQYDRELKLAALNRARADFSRAAAALLLAAGLEPDDPVARWLTVLEGELLPRTGEPGWQGSDPDSPAPLRTASRKSFIFSNLRAKTTR